MTEERIEGFPNADRARIRPNKDGAPRGGRGGRGRQGNRGGGGPGRGGRGGRSGRGRGRGRNGNQDRGERDATEQDLDPNGADDAVNGANGNMDMPKKSKKPFDKRNKPEGRGEKSRNDKLRQGKNRNPGAKRQQQQPPKSNKPAAEMTVLVHRINLVDGWSSGEHKEHYEAPQIGPHLLRIQDINVNSYGFRDPQSTDVEHDTPVVEDEMPQEVQPTTLGDIPENAHVESNGNGNAKDFFDRFDGSDPVPESNHPKKGQKGVVDNRIVVAHAPVSTEYGRRSSAMVALNDATSDKLNPYANEAGETFVHDKYWAQRKRLFSRFDDGIQLDAQGWYSVTPEAIADHVARRMGEAASILVEQQMERGEQRESTGFFGADGITILDAFSGCGGNAIAFGKLSPFSVSKVICCDTDVVKLRHAAHNAAIYGIPCDKLVFVLCNSLYVMDRCYRNGKLVESAVQCLHEKHSFQEECEGFTIGGVNLLPKDVDAVFMDPPWGGVDYNQVGKNGYDLAKHIHLSYNPAEFMAGDINGEARKEKVVDGEQLLDIAARATKTKFVVYDVPRNTNKQSLARAALAAGYQGNMKVEEHYLNGRLKTTTAYMGFDFSPVGRLSILKS